jgi:hypothetical protein
MATLSNLLGGGSSAGAIDHRKEGLPLFGIRNFWRPKHTYDIQNFWFWF